MDLHPDFSDLLAAFVAAEVRFALLGGYAVAYYGKPRATKDLDLLVSGTGDNPDRVATALDAFGAPANVVEAARVQSESEPGEPLVAAGRACTPSHPRIPLTRLALVRVDATAA